MRLPPFEAHTSQSRSLACGGRNGNQQSPAEFGNVDASQDRIAANYKDGVLAVTVAKKSESKATKIVIN